MESFVHLRKGRTPRAAARRPGRPEGRRTRPRRIHRPHREHLPPQRPHRLPQLRPAAARRRAVQRAQAQRRHRRARRADADVLQRRLPGSAVAAHRADAVLRPLRRRRPAVLRAQGLRPAGDRVRPAALPRGRLGVHPEGVHVPSPGARRRVDAADDPGHRRVPGATAGHSWAALPVRPVAGRHPRARADRRPSPVRRRRVRGAADPSTVRPDIALPTNTIRSTSRAGAATTSRSPSTSPTTTW